MLEFFRHHRGAFLTFLTVIIIISFSMWGGYTRSGTTGASPTDKAFTIYGRAYTRAEAERTQRLYMIAARLGMFQFAMGLMDASRNFETRDSSPLDFSLNLLVLENQMNALGIHPSDEEALKVMQDLSAFQKDGKFDPGQAAMVEEMLGASGVRSSDLLELVKYDIGLSKVKDLVTRNYSASTFASEKHYSALYQTLKGATIAFNLEDFKKTAKVEDAEIQKAYDEKKDSFKTAEKRSVRWVFFAEPEGLDKIEDVAARNKKQADFIEVVRAFADKTHQTGAKLEALTTEAKLKLETTPAFPEDTAPEALKASGTFVSAVFDLIPGERTITDPIKGDKGYYIGELVSVDEPKQQELAEVKAQISASLLDQKAREAMATAVNDTREELNKGLKEGKKIEDLAKAKKLTVTPFPDFEPNTPPPALANATDIAREAEFLAPGTVSKPVPVSTGVILVVVNAKELRKRQDGESLRKSTEASLASGERDQLFRAWFGRQKEAANVKLQVPLS
jgi:peptidyl-prolyl cis-trans isomerase D